MNHLSELEALKMKSNHLTDQSLDSTRRMIVLCDESKGAGIRTLVALDQQGEQLDKIEKDMDKINNDMKEAEQNITGMERWCGLCVCPWYPSKKFNEDKSTWKSSNDGLVIDGQLRPTTGNRRVVSAQYLPKITHDDREMEMEDNLSQVANMIGTMRSIAIDMRHEVIIDENKIGRIDRKVVSDHQRIRLANDRTNKLIK